MASVLFVCTANQFRSPIAAACFRRKYESLGWQSEWRVSSAGTWAFPGSPALPEAIQCAHRLGLPIQEHRALAVDARLVSEQDLILVMESGQKEALQSEFSLFRNRIFLLTEVVDERPQDIPDPVAHPDIPPFQIANQIADMVERGYYRICAQALKHSPAILNMPLYRGF
jgi:protein-tyrosine-phosphatase